MIVNFLRATKGMLITIMGLVSISVLTIRAAVQVSTMPMRIACAVSTWVTLDEDGVITVLRASDGSVIGSLSIYPERPVQLEMTEGLVVVLTASGKVLAISYHERKGKVELKEAVRLKNAEAVHFIRCAPDRIILGLRSGEILIVTEDKGVYHSVGIDHRDQTNTGIAAIALAENGTSLITAHLDDTIILEQLSANGERKVVSNLTSKENGLVDATILCIDNESNWLAADVRGIHIRGQDGRKIFYELAKQDFKIKSIAVDWKRNHALICGIDQRDRTPSYKVRSLSFGDNAPNTITLALPEAELAPNLFTSADSILASDSSSGRLSLYRVPAQENAVELSWSTPPLDDPAITASLSINKNFLAVVYEKLSTGKLSTIGVWSLADGSLKALIDLDDLQIIAETNPSPAISSRGDTVVIGTGSSYVRYRLNTDKRWNREKVESNLLPDPRTPQELVRSSLLGEVDPQIMSRFQSVISMLAPNDRIYLAGDYSRAFIAVATGLVINDLLFDGERRIAASGRPKVVCSDSIASVVAMASPADLSVFTVQSGQLLSMVPFDEIFELLAISNKGERVLLKTQGAILCYDLETDEPLWGVSLGEFPGFQPISGTFSDNDKWSLLKCSDHSYAILANRRNTKPRFISARELLLLNEDNRAIVVRAGGTVEMFSIESGKPLGSLSQVYHQGPK